MKTEGSWKPGHVPWNKGLTKENSELIMEHSKKLKGKKFSKKHKKNLSNSKKGKISEKQLENLLKAGRIGVKKIAEFRKGKSLEEIYGKEKSEELRVLMRKRMINRLTSGDFSKLNRTSIELKIDKLLLEKKIKFESQYPFFNKYSCDFAIPEKKLVIECDGDYWHNLPGTKEKDTQRDTFMESKGWNVLRLSEHDINKDINKCSNQIETFINGEDI